MPIQQLHPKRSIECTRSVQPLQIQAMAERGRAPVGGGGGANISQHAVMSNLTWPLTLSYIINIDDLDDRIVNKLMNQNDTLANYQEVLYNSIRFGDAVEKKRETHAEAALTTEVGEQ